MVRFPASGRVTLPIFSRGDPPVVAAAPEQARTFAPHEVLAKLPLQGASIGFCIRPVKSSVYKVFIKVVQDQAAYLGRYG